MRQFVEFNRRFAHVTGQLINIKGRLNKLMPRLIYFICRLDNVKIRRIGFSSYLEMMKSCLDDFRWQPDYFIA